MSLRRITPNIIAKLKDNEIFVFGSNQAGRHGKGAAKTAMQWGAIYGKANGLQGQTYAIPTKNADITQSLTIEEIKYYVDEFMQFAKNNPNLTFLVTEIGCGLAAFKPSEIAPLFKIAMGVDNIYLPIGFTEIIWKNFKNSIEQSNLQQ